MQALIVVGVFWGTLRVGGEDTARTMAFVTLSLLELFYAFNVRGEDARTRPSLFSNKTLLVTAAAGLAVTVLLVVTPLRGLFGLCALTPAEWAVALSLSLAIVPLGGLCRAAAQVIGWRPVPKKKRKFA